ncbi:MAG: SH3 domain-containing protein [Mastigocoleus sp. MO_167.B18]|nr:SH3 domain-containing protein [Mastigocoleus sp. MO_167.B18]
MDNLALLISYAENERDSVVSSHAGQTGGAKKQGWKNPKVWLSLVAFCLSLFTVCLSGAVAEAAPVRVNARSGLNVRTRPTTSSRVVTTLYNGQAVNTSGRVYRGWAQLDNGDWVVKRYLTYVSSGGGTGGGSRAARVQSVYGVNVRTGPNTRSRIIDSLRNGTEVTTSGRTSGDWVQLDNGYWIHGDYLSFGRRSGGGTGGGTSTSFIRHVNSYTHGANIRSGPGTNYSKVNYFSNGTPLSLTGRSSNGWYELTRGRGWIAGNLLRV